MRLAVVGHAAFMQGVFKLPIVLVGDQVADGLAEVPEELVAGLGALPFALDDRRRRKWAQV